MATRENQTLQISLMVFAILVVILAGLSYWFYSSWQKTEANLASKETDLKNVREDANKKIAESQKLKEQLGYSTEENIDSIGIKFEEDMSKYASDFTELGQRNYRHVIEIYSGENRQSQSNERAAKDIATELKNKLDALELELNEQIKKYSDEATAANLASAQERDKFNKERDDWKVELAQVKQDAEAERAKFDTAIKEKEAKIVELAAKLDDSIKLVADLKTLLELDSDNNVSYAKADGMIKRVELNDEIVYINLGFADGLRNQVTFNVYPRGELIKTLKIPDPESSKKFFSGTNPEDQPTPNKAKIEVVEILGDHTAECKIISSTFGDPIVPGDQIHTPAWQAGRSVHYAIVGDIDLDKDGKMEPNVLRDIIMQNGGIIDLYVDDAGEIQGELTVDTKYLIRGISPKAGTPQYESMTRATEDADRQSIQIRSVERFLEEIGWKRGERSVSLGEQARGSDFPPKLEGGVQKTDIGASRREQFKKRVPY